MKQGSFKAICLVLLVVISAVAAFGDEITVDLNSFIVESFDGDSGYEWAAIGSKFATKNDDGNFPRVMSVAAWPQALFGYNRDGKDLKALGIWGRFDRRGYNWVDIYPVSGGDGEAKAAEIPLPGRVQYLDVWFWGSNLDYYVEAYIRDYRGVVHVLDAGHLNYQGWKDLRIRVPSTIPQSRVVIPRLSPLSFVKFRIWTLPTQPVDNFYVYIDQFKVLSDTFETIFDGDELSNPEHVQELWGGSGNN
jgi:hypothetical protein